jgi:hypothetical protein
MYVDPHVGSVVDLLLTAPVPRASRRGALSGGSQVPAPLSACAR